MSVHAASQSRPGFRIGAQRAVIRALSVFGLLVSTLLPATLHAQTACVPQAGGVPGLPGPPDWAVPLPPPLTPTAIDDPRWRGAARETFPDALAGTTPDVATRLIHSGGSLFMQFQALGDVTAGTVSNPGTGNIYWDAAYVGFANAAFTSVQIVRVGVDSTGATFIYRWEKTGASWVGIPGPPAWLTANKAWNTQSVSGLSITWTINLKIAMGSAPGTKFWYAADMAQLPNVAVETFAFPSRGGFAQPSPAPDTAIAATTWGAQFDKIRDPNSDGVFTDSAWGDLNAYTGALPAACSGIRLEDNAIGTQFDWKIATNQSNIFHAQLSAVGVPLPPAGAVKARFRIANWGMTIGVDGSWNDIPGGTYADNRVNDAAGLIQFTCPFPPACPTLPAGSNPDQCMLVEVQGASGPISFLKDSAWRNMLFGTASRFEHLAEISLVGLAQATQPRDVYLAVKAHNMPAKVDPNAPPPGTNDGPDPKQDPYFRYKLQDLSPTEQLIVRGQPVYEVRGYRDTGKGTGTTQIVAPMVPYGYVINHTGALVGWQHQLSGVGTTVVTTLIPDKLYKISVLPGGKATIKDSIEALEKVGPPPVPPCTRCCCDFRRRDDGSAALGLFALLGLGICLRARRTRRTLD
ncbi:MAG: hypothetical protein ACOY0T_16785 [Myxococcota bacterium]